MADLLPGLITIGRSNGWHGCDYIGQQATVDAKHGFWMSQAEHDAIPRTITNRCPVKKAVTTDGYPSRLRTSGGDADVGAIGQPQPPCLWAANTSGTGNDAADCHDSYGAMARSTYAGRILQHLLRLVAL